MKRFYMKKDGITFSFDYYVEMLGVISILCEDQELIEFAGAPRCNDEYIRAVKEYFSNCDYKRVTELLSLFSDEYYFNYDAPIMLMLSLSNNATIDKGLLFKDRKPIPDALFDEFISEVHRFDLNSVFISFYESNFTLYERIINNYLSDHEKYNPKGFLTDFLQLEPQKEFVINFMLGITNANYACSVGDKVYSNIRPYYLTRYDALPDYSYHALYFTTLTLHEFAHSFINPITAEFSELISKIDPEKYAYALEENGYGDSVETFINETIIRAIECLYVKEHFPANYQQFINEYIEEGYINLPNVVKKIKDGIDTNTILNILKTEFHN